MPPTDGASHANFACLPTRFEKKALAETPRDEGVQGRTVLFNLPRPLLRKEGRAWGRMGSPLYEGGSSLRFARGQSLPRSIGVS